MNKKQKVYVAMSGGVDSSVAAALLKSQGYDVTGVFMRPWSPYGTNSKLETLNSKPQYQSTAEPEQSTVHGREARYGAQQIQNSKFKIQNSSFCLWQKDREDAMRVVAKIGIPLLTWDFSKEYKREVADYMIREYRSGRTPNPDVMCNKHIKFGLFLEKALKEGADFIATGHYARLRRQFPIYNFQFLNKSKTQNPKKIENLNIENSLKIENCKLKIAKDTNKDQSYFLWTLTQQQLRYCLFPIGDYTKPEVRKLAKKFGLPTADKKDSQGVCFVGPLDMKEFLKNYIKPKKGLVLRFNLNTVVGEHDGVFYYTIGQRHGLDIKDGKGPYYVIDKDIKKNIIYVGKEHDLAGKTAKVSNLNWLNENIIPHFFKNKGHLLVDVKIRYRGKSKKAVLSKNGSLKFKNLIRAITPGQSAVFYKGNEIVGGGIIE